MDWPLLEHDLDWGIVLTLSRLEVDGHAIGRVAAVLAAPDEVSVGVQVRRVAALTADVLMVLTPFTILDGHGIDLVLRHLFWN